MNSNQITIQAPGFAYPEGVILIGFTNSIQDDELEEAIIEAYAKHGPKLADLIRNL